MEQLLKKHGDKLRFALVGGVNTALDFLLLFIFTGIGVNKYVANYLSTGVSLIFSFYANKSFTFKDTSKNAKRQFTAFLVITLIGLWAIQPLVIWVSGTALEAYITNDEINLFVAKLIATVASLIWNYLLYSKLVFKKLKEKK